MGSLYADWSCKLLPLLLSTDQNLCTEAISAIEYLRQRHGFDRFVFPLDYDCRMESIPHLLLRKKRAEDRLKAMFSDRSFKVLLRAELVPGLHQLQGLEKLLTSKDGYLPLVLPMTAYQDWIDRELNRLLYTAKIKRLMLASFEICMLLYPPEIVQKLLRIPHLVPQLGYRALSEPAVQAVLTELIRQDRTVLFGTNVDSLHKAYQLKLVDLDDRKSATERLSFADYRMILQRAHHFVLVE